MAPRSYGAKKTGPDLSWADDDLVDPNDRNNRAVSPPSNVPGPVFPPRTYKNIIRTPKPLGVHEKKAVDAQLRFRQRCRESPLFTVLDKNRLLVDGVSRKSTEAKRRGFDPFEQQERYSTRHLKKARTEPDLGPQGRGDYGYTLAMFPEELWGVLDPGLKLPDWKLVDEGGVAYANLPGRRKPGSEKKKRKKALDYERLDREVVARGDQAAEQEDTDDEDPVQAESRKKRKTKDKLGRQEGERRGLDAEDDVDTEQNPEDAEEEAGEDEPEDSDFSDDSDQNDYDAEQYFDDGEDDDDGGDDNGGGDDY